MSYRPIFVLISVVIAAVLAAFSISSLDRARGFHEQALLAEAERLRTGFETSTMELEQAMAIVARMIAEESEIRALMAQAVSTVTAEGGGSGAAQSALVRDRLQNAIADRWSMLQRDYGLRQMQFLLPGSVSFLRLHAPGRFGDALNNARPLLGEVERTQSPQSGFEMGRAYAGLRGAAPIITQVDGRERFVGMIEVGTNFEWHIAEMSRRTDIGYGVLLDPAIVSEVMWKEFSAHNTPQLQPCCFLLTATRPELQALLHADALPHYDGTASIALLPWQGRHLQLIRLPLHEFGNRSRPDHGSVGSFVIWRDVSAEVLAHQQDQRRIVMLTLLAYAAAVVLLYGVIRASRREWQRQLDEQTLEIARLAHRNEVLLMSAGEGIFGIDPRGLTTFINPAALNMLGLTEAQALGADQHALAHHHYPNGTEYPTADCPICHTLHDGKRRDLEDWFIRKDGTGFPVQLTVMPIADGDTGGAVVVFRDITELKEKEQKLREQASTDALTGVSNRRSFFERLEQELSRIRRETVTCALLMVDLDFFKRINDSHGHAAGDTVLKAFAVITRQVVRDIDTIGRLGGEEFAVLLPDDDIHGAAAVAERLRAAVEACTVSTETGPVRFTISLGVTTLRAEDTLADLALQRADEALYAAKGSGRNRVCLHPSDTRRPALTGETPPD